jgi:hypothetical protein
MGLDHLPSGSVKTTLVKKPVEWPRRGSAVLAAFIFAYSVAWVSIASYSGDARKAWHVLRVPAMQRSFDDFRVVLEGVDCVRRGINPHLEPGCDWRKRPFNYPSVWLSLSHVGVTVQDTDALGIAIGALFTLSVLLSFRRASPMAGLIGGVCVISPAIGMGIERGNTDLLIFSLLVAGSMLASTLRRGGAIVLSAAILVAAVLKLYPIAAIVCLLRRQRRTLAVALSTTALFACWIYYWRDDLSLVRATTPEFAWKSFGYKTFFISVFQYVSRSAVRMDAAGYLAPTSLPPFFELIAKLVLLLAIIASVSLGILTRRLWALDLEFGYENQCRFLIGASVYALTFALGTNFNYRLIFLILCIPQSVAWVVEPRVSASFRRFAMMLTTGIVAICWASAATERTIFRAPTELVSWCLFVGFGLVITNQLMPLVPTIARFGRNAVD